MNNEDILKIINNNPDSYVMIIKSKYKSFYDYINNNYFGNSFGEKLYRHINLKDVHLGKCKNCNKDVKFKSFIVGFSQFCCKKCSNTFNRTKITETRKQTSKLNRDLYFVTKRCAVCNTPFESYKFRNQKCCSVKCSGIYVGIQPQRINRIKKTKKKKYGNASYVNVDKAKKTCIERYGVDNIFKCSEIKKLIKEINVQKYGTEYPSQTDEIKNKIKNTNLLKYGVDNPSKSLEIKNKVKSSFLKKYGVDNVFKHKETVRRIYEENYKKYGCKIPVNSDKLKKLMIERLRETLYDSIVERLNNKSECTPLFTRSEYLSTDRENKYGFQCKKCNNVFYDHIDGGHLPRCLTCNPYIAGFSIHEKEIVEYIKSITKCSIIENNRSILNGLELDIYIPDKNIAIEYNGLYWHGEKNGGKHKTYHLEKTNKCLQKNIKLIHIFEDEWIHKKEIVKNKLKHIICENKNEKIYARKCIIKQINETKWFLDEYHIQGNCPSSIKLGAFYNDELIAVMTFGKQRVALGTKKQNDNEYELLRFVTSKRIVGVASKLLNYFIKTYNPNKIVTFADKRYSVGNLYEKLKFTKVCDTQPNYWYFIDGGDTLRHRFSFRKDILHKKLKNYDEKLTEWQNMKNNGYDRIWDCGNIKYIWNK